MKVNCYTYELSEFMLNKLKSFAHSYFAIPSTQLSSASSSQMPPQSCFSDEYEEAKLDASHLQQEWDIHSTHDDDVSSCYGGGVTSLPVRAQAQYDSDSDLEDFQHVIGESMKALLFTEGTLTKTRKDAMETGIVLDPSEYNESLATCKTNIRCLQEVLATLESEVALSNVTDDDIANVEDVVARWRCVERLAEERLVQSQQLTAFYREMLRAQTSLDATDELLDRNDFTEPAALETIVYAIQVRSFAILFFFFSKKRSQDVPLWTDFIVLVESLRVRCCSDCACVSCRSAVLILRASVNVSTMSANQRKPSKTTTMTST